jgi:hypothetical protein
MNTDVVVVNIKAIVPVPMAKSYGVFLGNDEKTFVIYVDQFVANAIQMSLTGTKNPRPLTHDLIGSVLLGLGAQLDHIVINDVDDGTFFARILLKMENEIGKKIIEIDARPSDSIVLALQHKRPIYVAQKVFDAVKDETEILERVLKKQSEEEEGEPGGEEDELT